MKSQLVATLEDFRNILGMCPQCEEIFRLTDIQISYRAKPRRTWLDELEEVDDRLQRAEDRFDEKEGEIRDLAVKRGRRRLPALLRKVDPIFSSRGFFPQDAKPLFDPVDFVIFDGMNRKGLVSRIVLFDGPAGDSARDKIQRSLERTIRGGNYEWQTVHIQKDGTLGGKRRP